MELFAPDNHTRNEVRFLPPSADQLRMAQAAFLAHFGHSVDDNLIQIIEGANVNSANFRIGAHYLKCIKLGALAPIALLPLSLRLEREGIPVAQFLPSKAGAIPSPFEFQGIEYLAYVQKFSSGGFHPGTKKAIVNFLALWPKLRGAFAGWEPTEGQRKPFDAPAELLSPHIEMAGKNADSFDRKILSLRTLLLNTEQETNDTYFKSPFSLQHFDLHPHNFLCDGDAIKLVLDLESFRWMPTNLSLAFGLFKLGRKGLASKVLSRGEFQEVLQKVEVEKGELLYWTRKELLRRIGVVLSLHYGQKNFAWDQDLEKHARGLLEAEQLFRPN